MSDSMVVKLRPSYWKLNGIFALLVAGCLAPVLLLAEIPQDSESNASTQSSAPVYSMQIQDEIGQTSIKRLSQALKETVAGGGQLLLIHLDTPGGLYDATRTMVQTILASPIPVAIYVAPEGARAASAGTYLLYASHIAAMAPVATVGAATPVRLSVDQDTVEPVDQDAAEPDDPEQESDQPGKNAEEDSKPTPANDAMTNKIVNDARSFLKSLAELRNRNAEWADKAILTGDSITSEQALSLGVIEYIAPSERDLLRQISGQSIQLQDQVVVLDTADAPIVALDISAFDYLTSRITNPSVAGLLLLVAGALIWFEFSIGLGGIGLFIGLVALFLGSYGLGILSIEVIEFEFLLLLGFLVFLFLVADILLGFSGFIVSGGALLSLAIVQIWSELQASGGQSVSLGWIAVVAVLVVSFVVWLVFQIQNLEESFSGQESMVKKQVEVLEDFKDSGWVLFDGERWRGQIEGQVYKGQKLVIKKRDRMQLTLRHP
ncbi:MAG: NfeD family protein [Gammaproteobacteria bacterium]